MKGKTLSSKLVAFLLAFCLLMSAAVPALLPQVKAEEGGATFIATADKTEVHPGDTFTTIVSVTPDSTAGVGSYEVALDYNHDRLEIASSKKILSIPKPGAGGSTGVYSNWFAPDPVENLFESTQLYEVTFKVKADATFGTADLGMDVRVVGNGAADDITSICTGTATEVAITEKPAEPVPVTGITVTPKTAEIFMGATTTLSAAVVPENADVKTFTWSSSDASIAQVNAATGEVTGVKTGTANIIATSTDGAKTDSCAVTVKEDTVAAVVLKTPPTKLNYIEGEKLDVTGGVVTVTMGKGSVSDLELTAEMCTVDMNKIGEQEVVVAYGGVKAEAGFKVTIVSKEVTSIEITKAPTGVTYIGDEKANLDGGEMKVLYNNGTDDTKALSEAATVSGFNNKATGKQTLTITYGTKTATCEINVLYKGTVTTEDGSEVTLYGTPESTFSGEVTLKVEKIDTPAGSVDSARKQFGEKADIMRTLNITLTDADGKLISDTGKIRIGVKLSADEIKLAEAGRLIVCYVDDKGAVTKVDTDAYNGDGMLYFTTDHLSNYALVKTEQAVNPPVQPEDSNNPETKDSSIVNPYTGQNFSQNEVNGFIFLLVGFAIVAVSGFKILKLRKKQQ